MKKSKFISVLFALIMTFCSVVMPVSADGNTRTTESVEYFEDGSYITTFIQEFGYARSAFKTGTKTSTYKNADNETQWSYTITGTFFYNPGVSATCTAVTDTYVISNDSWHMDHHSCSKSGASASGTATFKYKVLGITTKTLNRTVTISCSSTGVLS